MKLQPAVGEHHRTEANPRGREPAPTELAGQGTAFDDVLAGVGGPATQPRASALPSGDDASLSTGASKRTPVTGDVFGTSATTDVAVSSLMKRFKSKQDAEDAQAATANGATSNAATLASPGLAASLLMELHAATNGAAGTAPSSTTAPTGTSDLQKSALLAAPGSAPGAGATGIVGISLATHVAPSAGPEAKPGFDNAAQTSGALAPPAGTAQAGASTEPAREVQVDAKLSAQARSADPDAPDIEADQSKQADAPKISAGTSGDAGTGQHGAPNDDGASDKPVPKLVDGPVAAASTAVAPQQPVGRIATALVELAAQASAAAPAEAPKAQAAVARTVTLQMSPADLGTVEVRLHLSGHALDLHLTISEHETAGLVTRERETLTAALQAHGYDLHSLVIQDAGGAGSSGGSHVPNHQSPGDERPERQGGGESRGGQAGANREDRDGGRQARGGPPPGIPEPSRSGSGDHRSLFV